MHLRELNELSEAIRTQYALIVDGHSSSTLPGCLLLCLGKLRDAIARSHSSDLSTILQMEAVCEAIQVCLY